MFDDPQERRRCELFEGLRSGALTPETAEALAAKIGIPPLCEMPYPDEHDPRKRIGPTIC